VTQFQIECIESKTETNYGQYSKFVLEPLDRGQGTTIGNALRRVLLSNLEGAAVTAVRIAGVNHEFATIPGVREDVLEILLNMKEIVLKSYTNQPQTGRLTAQGPGRVTASNFKLSSEYEVVNPNQYVATLSEGADLEMEFRIETGKGYKAIDKVREEGAAIDYLQIDAVFMPVQKVNCTVEDMRVDGSLEKDRLILEALSKAAVILLDLFSPLKNMDLAPPDQGPADTPDSKNQIPIEELQLSVRAYNCLKRAQINTVADLLQYTYEELLEIKNFGQKSAEEVVEALQRNLAITLPNEKSAKG
jgi:DNA-directed RNA polymerase subunit alpha